jgi:hypothetical protein
MYATEDEIQRQVIDRMGQVFQDYTRACAELYDIKSGKSVVIPVDIDHAKMMVLIGQHYISEQHKETIRAIKQGT